MALYARERGKLFLGGQYLWAFGYAAASSDGQQLAMGDEQLSCYQPISRMLSPAIICNHLLSPDSTCYQLQSTDITR